MVRKGRPIRNYLAEHQPYILGARSIGLAEYGELDKGMVVRFSYNGEVRYVFVIHPNWDGLLHGLDLKYVPRTYLLQIANAPEDWDPSKLYEEFLQRVDFKRLDSYRTYSLGKMRNVSVVAYDARLEGGPFVPYSEEGKITDVVADEDVPGKKPPGDSD